MERKLTIYTIGHSNFSSQEFMATLNSFGINLVVDVRSYPVSKQNPHFHKNELSFYLPQNGIEYHYSGNSLGGMRTDPALLNGNKTDYLKVQKLESFQQGINSLLKLAERKNTALMCGEAEPFNCHRHLLISQDLIDKGIEVIHILKTGKTKTAGKAKQKLQFALF